MGPRLTAAFAFALAGCSLMTPARDPCRSSSECRDLFGAGFYCEASSGLCQPVESDVCPQVYPVEARTAPGALLFGTMFAGSSPNHRARLRAAQLAVDALNGRGGIDGRSVALLECDLDRASALDASARLVEVSVPAIVGPSRSTDVEAVFSAHRDDGVLVISPAATATQLTAIDTARPGLLWRTAPPDTLQADVILEDLSTFTSLSIVARQNDTYAQSLSVLLQEGASEQLLDVLESVQFADPDHLDVAAAGAIGPAPEVVVFISSQVADAAAFLRATGGMAAYDGVPIFLTDAAANDDLFRMGMIPAQRLLQIRATRPSAPDTIVTSEFVANYRAAYDGEDPLDFTFTAHTYDAMALVLLGAGFSLGARDEASAGGIAEGITRMNGTGPAHALLGAEFLPIISQLRTSEEGVDVTGASGPLDYDAQEELTTAEYDVLVVDRTADDPPMVVSPPRFVIESTVTAPVAGP